MLAFVGLELATKGIVRTSPGSVWQVGNPHYYVLNNGGLAPTALANGEPKTSAGCAEKRPDVARQLNDGCGPWANWAYYGRTDLGEVSAFVAHYMWQARYICAERKLLLPRDDNGKYRAGLTPRDSFAKWDSECNHAHDNDIVDTIVADRYAANLRNSIKSFARARPPRSTPPGPYENATSPELHPQ